MRFLLAAFFALATPAHADGFGFQTPSGNIYCNGFVSDGGGIDCSIVERNPGPPAQPRPVNCNASWGHTFSLNGRGGAATLSCGRHPQRVNYSDVAPYGVSAQFGAITCTSERTGLTCTNPSGHGFFLSRRQQLAY